MEPATELPDLPAETEPTGGPVMPEREAWARLSPSERGRALSTVLEDLEEREIDQLMTMAEGDLHGDACDGMRDTLRAFYRDRKTSIYVSAGIPVHYPGERGFSPDVVVATEVPPGPREAWVVADEGKGLDLVVEVYHKGSWRKDFVDNVKRPAATDQKHRASGTSADQ